jgi:hypothetical protein
MESGFNNLVEYISMQLSPENISDIINTSLQSSLKKYIDEYVSREIKNLIMKALSVELETIKNQVCVFINESKKILDMNLEVIKKFGNIQHVETNPLPGRDEILENIEMKRFNLAVESILKIQDNQYQDYYLSSFSIGEVNENNLSQQNAVDLAFLAIGKRNKEILLKMVTIIKKGEGLLSVLRKIVQVNDPDLIEIRNMIIKRNL